MRIFDLLKENKGTVSSALGKELAGEVLNGDLGILDEAIALSVYEPEDMKEKSIRAGAAKIVEIVAEKKPELVAPHLNKLIHALGVDEPQTKWMTLRTFGFCAEKNPKDAEKAIEYAVRCMENKQGLCLSSSAVLYLGDLGAVSKEYAKKVFPLIEKESKNPVLNEEDWILEAYLNIAGHLKEKSDEIAKFAYKNIDAPKKSTQKRANKLLKIIESS